MTNLYRQIYMALFQCTVKELNKQALSKTIFLGLSLAENFFIVLCHLQMSVTVLSFGASYS